MLTQHELKAFSSHCLKMKPHEISGSNGYCSSFLLASIMRNPMLQGAQLALDLKKKLSVHTHKVKAVILNTNGKQGLPHKEH